MISQKNRGTTMNKNKRKQISKELQTQDNRATKDPFFIVYEKEEVVIPEGYAGVGVRYHHADSSETYEMEELKESLEDSEIECDENNYLDVAKRNGYEEYSYKYVNRFVQGFFTEKAANEYIESNSHNLHKPFTYVIGLYRNYELQNIRNMLIKNDYRDECVDTTPANKTAKDIEFLKSLDKNAEIVIFKKGDPFMFINKHDIFKLEYDGDMKPFITLRKKKLYTESRRELGYFEIVPVKKLLYLINAQKIHEVK